LSRRQHQWHPAAAADRVCTIMMLCRHSATYYDVCLISPCIGIVHVSCGGHSCFCAFMFMWLRQEQVDCRYRVQSTHHNST